MRRRPLGGQRGYSTQLEEGLNIPPRGLIGNPEIQGRLIRALGIRERAPAPTLAPEILPVVIVQDLTDIEESNIRALRGCVGAGTQTGDTITSGAVVLFNPLGSGVYVRIEEMMVSCSFNSIITMDLTPGAPPTAGAPINESFTNTQLGFSSGGVAPVAQVRTGLEPPSTDPKIRAQLGANVVWYIRRPIILVPSSFVLWGTSSASAVINVTFFWDEYETEGKRG